MDGNVIDTPLEGRVFLKDAQKAPAEQLKQPERPERNLQANHGSAAGSWHRAGGRQPIASRARVGALVANEMDTAG